jgi:hypothetical protein
LSMDFCNLSTFVDNLSWLALASRMSPCCICASRCVCVCMCVCIFTCVSVCARAWTG